ncbi:titin homolog [Ctenocephalides felis]|uniref:titin homolog n=1 Tax=Ctenocephalides felis TaxID=7515 RepID=UPI000E6E4589|nr:titin homolog [Ctenocephalides felis]
MTRRVPPQRKTSGCYYNYQHYEESDRIITNEPCLNCTCHNRMLMCYLRVCPFTKPIGLDCVIEKREDQCCPVITCPEVPVELMTSTASSTDVGHLNTYGCSIKNKFYPDGARLPSNPHNPCELCYCIRNSTTCVMQECTLHVPGCTPIYKKGLCCPERYECDHDEELLQLDDTTTTVRPTPGYLLPTTTISSISQSCMHNNEEYADGTLIITDKPCEHCYCMRGDIVCAVQECGTPLENEGKNCTALPPRNGQCCPDTYICGTLQDDEHTTQFVDHSIPLATEASPISDKNLVDQMTENNALLTEKDSEDKVVDQSISTEQYTETDNEVHPLETLDKDLPNYTATKLPPESTTAKVFSEGYENENEVDHEHDDSTENQDAMAMAGIVETDQKMHSESQVTHMPPELITNKFLESTEKPSDSYPSDEINDTDETVHDLNKENDKHFITQSDDNIIEITTLAAQSISEKEKLTVGDNTAPEESNAKPTENIDEIKQETGPIEQQNENEFNTTPGEQNISFIEKGTQTSTPETEDHVIQEDILSTPNDIIDSEGTSDKKISELDEASSPEDKKEISMDTSTTQTSVGDETNLLEGDVQSVDEQGEITYNTETTSSQISVEKAVETDQTNEMKEEIPSQLPESQDMKPSEEQTSVDLETVTTENAKPALIESDVQSASEDEKILDMKDTDNKEDSNENILEESITPVSTEEISENKDDMDDKKQNVLDESIAIVEQPEISEKTKEELESENEQKEANEEKLDDSKDEQLHIDDLPHQTDASTNVYNKPDYTTEKPLLTDDDNLLQIPEKSSENQISELDNRINSESVPTDQDKTYINEKEETDLNQDIVESSTKHVDEGDYESLPESTVSEDSISHSSSEADVEDVQSISDNLSHIPTTEENLKNMDDETNMKDDKETDMNNTEKEKMTENNENLDSILEPAGETDTIIYNTEKNEEMEQTVTEKDNYSEKDNELEMHTSEKLHESATKESEIEETKLEQLDEKDEEKIDLEESSKATPSSLDNVEQLNNDVVIDESKNENEMKDVSDIDSQVEQHVTSSDDIKPQELDSQTPSGIQGSEQTTEELYSESHKVHDSTEKLEEEISESASQSYPAEPADKLPEETDEHKAEDDENKLNEEKVEIMSQDIEQHHDTKEDSKIPFEETSSTQDQKESEEDSPIQTIQIPSKEQIPIDKEEEVSDIKEQHTEGPTTSIDESKHDEPLVLDENLPTAHIIDEELTKQDALPEKDVESHTEKEVQFQTSTTLDENNLGSTSSSSTEENAKTEHDSLTKQKPGSEIEYNNEEDVSTILSNDDIKNEEHTITESSVPGDINESYVKPTQLSEISTSSTEGKTNEVTEDQVTETAVSPDFNVIKPGDKETEVDSDEKTNIQEEETHSSLEDTSVTESVDDEKQSDIQKPISDEKISETNEQEIESDVQKPISEENIPEKDEQIMESDVQKPISDEKISEIEKQQTETPSTEISESQTESTNDDIKQSSDDQNSAITNQDEKLADSKPTNDKEFDDISMSIVTEISVHDENAVTQQSGVHEETDEDKQGQIYSTAKPLLDDSINEHDLDNSHIESLEDQSHLTSSPLSDNLPSNNQDDSVSTAKPLFEDQSSDETTSKFTEPVESHDDELPSTKSPLTESLDSNEQNKDAQTDENNVDFNSQSTSGPLLDSLLHNKPTVLPDAEKTKNDDSKPSEEHQTTVEDVTDLLETKIPDVSESGEQIKDPSDDVKSELDQNLTDSSHDSEPSTEENKDSESEQHESNEIQSTTASISSSEAATQESDGPISAEQTKETPDKSEDEDDSHPILESSSIKSPVEIQDNDSLDSVTSDIDASHSTSRPTVASSDMPDTLDAEKSVDDKPTLAPESTHINLPTDENNDAVSQIDENIDAISDNNKIQVTTYSSNIETEEKESTKLTTPTHQTDLSDSQITEPSDKNSLLSEDQNVDATTPEQDKEELVEEDEDLLQYKPAAIPGEGSCLVEGVTYANNTSIPSNNKCQIGCFCLSSVIKCDAINCAPPPPNMVRCQPVYHGLDCCPTYVCEGFEQVTLKSDSYMAETHVTRSPSENDISDNASTAVVDHRPEESDHHTEEQTKEATSEGYLDEMQTHKLDDVATAAPEMQSEPLPTSISSENIDINDRIQSENMTTSKDDLSQQEILPAHSHDDSIADISTENDIISDAEEHEKEIISETSTKDTTKLVEDTKVESPDIEKPDSEDSSIEPDYAQRTLTATSPNVSDPSDDHHKDENVDKTDKPEVSQVLHADDEVGSDEEANVDSHSISDESLTVDDHIDDLHKEPEIMEEHIEHDHNIPEHDPFLQNHTLVDESTGDEHLDNQFPQPSYGQDYEDENDEQDAAFGPGTCRYGGKVYVSAQQIPRDDPCDFCFCFRSDIICLQQSCPPPIRGCHEEPISGFCCPRYECPVSMATVLNVSTTTTTTTTTLPPHFSHHAYNGAATKTGCQIGGQAYTVGEVVRSASGPCLHCICGGDGQMQCEPKVCSPEPMLRQMIAAASSRRRR